MVKLEEVDDEEFVKEQPGPQDEDDWDTDDEDDVSEPADDAIDDETLLDRITALKDIVPASTRRQLVSTTNTAYSYLSTGAAWGGKALWIVSTSALLLGVPWALAYAEEQQMIEMEREMKMQQQAGAMLGQQSAEQGQARPAL
ncbi:hypothetical protein LTS18_009657 [Coniosporium uncinatum]|uniref:Uncharacterized protein n=1 Tax=Coniosporium uncinatum TaxID=93489 RepID=A0ACC3DAG6_9PEZI|nr:hypothetical protein LTS18_009657 [Coniosporium uncinatum]